MKKIKLLLLTQFIFFTAVMAQEITGTWNGILNVQGTQLPLIFHISKNPNGYSSTMESPDQSATNIPASSTVFDGKALKLSIEKFGIEYNGSLDKDSNIVGEFRQGGLVIPLTISRKKVEKTVLIRPQEPKKPYPYKSEEVSFYNAKGKDTLAGTLTLPAGKGSFPAVILITGSGAQNRDEELMGHKPFLVLSDFLTRNGIAVLRYDDRGVAASTGNFAAATTNDFADDAEAAFNFLRTRADINKNKIGLMGHSEGGVIAPMVAARNKDVAFIVMLAGTGLPGDQILIMQQQLIGKASGIQEKDLVKVKKQYEGAYAIVKKYNDIEEIKSALKTYMKLPEEVEEKIITDEDIAVPLKQIANPWMINFIKYDPAIALKKVKCPVLAINGSNDLQVPPKEDLAAIKNALEKGGNKNITVQEIPGLNHLFQTSATGNPSEYAKIEETFSPVAMHVVLDWLKLQLAK